MIPFARPIFPAVLAALRLAMGVIFLWAGLAKIPEPGFFAQTLRAYEILPLAWIHPYAIVMPWIEVVAGLLLVLGLWTCSSALVGLLLLLSFGAAIGVNLYRGADFACGCFGLDGREGSLTEALVQDGFLMAVSLLLIRTSDLPLSFDRVLSRRR